MRDRGEQMAASLRERYRDDPVAFAREVLGVKLSEWQTEMLRQHGQWGMPQIKVNTNDR